MSRINDTIAVVKSGLDVSIHLATAEEKEKLADAKLALADLKDQMAELKDENRDLKEKSRLKEVVQYGKSGVAYISGEKYCGGCLGSKGYQVHLLNVSGVTFDCPTCKARYFHVGSNDINMN